VLSPILRIFVYIMVLFGCQSCVISGYTTSLMLQGGYLDVSMDTMNKVLEKVNEQMVMILLVSNLLTILIICLGMTLRRKNPKTELGLHSVNFMRIPTFAIFGTALNIFVSVTLSFIPFPESIVEAFEGQYSTLYGGPSIVVEILSVAVVTGIVEELIFRGIAMTRLKRSLGTPAAIIISAVIFGVVHGTPIAIMYATLLGILFALIYNTYDSVIPCIVCHIFFNMTSYWLPADNNTAVMILYAVSIVAIVYCIYRIFIRRPTFYDMIMDTDGRIPPINDEETAILERLRRFKDDGTMRPEDLEQIEMDWTENRKRYKKEKITKKINKDQDREDI